MEALGKLFNLTNPNLSKTASIELDLHHIRNDILQSLQQVTGACRLICKGSHIKICKVAHKLRQLIE